MAISSAPKARKVFVSHPRASRRAALAIQTAHLPCAKSPFWWVTFREQTWVTSRERRSLSNWKTWKCASHDWRKTSSGGGGTVIKVTKLKKRLESLESRLTEGFGPGDASMRSPTAAGGLGV